MPAQPLLGAHVSTAGGLATAFPRGRELGCEAMQIFVKSPSQWRGRPLGADEVGAFVAARAEDPAPLVAHAAYLINLAAPDPAILDKSRAALADELARAASLGLLGVVVHPGAHLGAGVEAGIDAVARSLDAVLAELPADGPRVLLELTAGQGTVLGHSLEQLRAMRDRTAAAARVGYCLDTCHACAAGYALDTGDGVDAFLEAADRILGLAHVVCWHLNDSVGAVGSRKDRHASIGAGAIGSAGFRRLLRSPALGGVPAILETPLGDDELGHARDLATLRRLLTD
ncbi:MAG: deoxyribonuclease IV [Thermoanaerobaculia bacterium]|nr:deoxyribonuclease IV [Thermoanaerobaculia bacterium]